MHDFPYPSYLRTHRDRWKLTQPELGLLLGIRAASAISKIEKLVRQPSVEALVGSEFVFGEPARRLFPALYAEIETKVTARAVLFAERLAADHTRRGLVKRQLLEEIARRVASDQLSI